MHLTYIPVLSTTGELKTKPTQHSVKELRTVGIQPDFIVARTHSPLDRDIRRKISLFCDVPLPHVIEGLDLPTIYEVPLALEAEGFPDKVLQVLSLSPRKGDHKEWEEFVARLKNPDSTVRIGIVGKYVELHDAYISIIEAFQHAGASLGVRVELSWIPSARVEETIEVLQGLSGILVPGGFGERGIEGKIVAADYARRKGLPYFGICLGMQVAVIAFARHVLGLEGANSTEFDPNTPHPVIDLLPEQKHLRTKGGTMRLGAYPAVLRSGTRIEKIYGKPEIAERHRHRYEFNLDYLGDFERAGMVASGLSPDERLVETVELPDHPWYIGVQFHPEYTSRPLRPHPLFVDFVRACAERRP